MVELGLAVIGWFLAGLFLRRSLNSDKLAAECLDVAKKANTTSAELLMAARAYEVQLGLREPEHRTVQ